MAYVCIKETTMIDDESCGSHFREISSKPLPGIAVGYSMESDIELVDAQPFYDA